jgi:hypothetical protein
MTPQAAYTGPDPLEWARKQLDFEATAKRGPTPREVLFKAQTIVPIARPHINSKPLTATAAVLLALAVLLAPWLPERTALLTAYIVLDRQYTRAQAQEITYKTAKRLPSDELLGAQFLTNAGADENASGALRLSFTTLGAPAAKLAADANWALMSVIKGDPAKLQRPMHLQSVSWRSPVMTLWNAVATLKVKKSATERPGEKLSQNLLRHQQLVLDGLRDQLDKEGFTVSAASYLDLGGKGSGSTHDLALDSWPVPLGLSIERYSALGEKERARVRASAQGFLDRMNLGAAPLAFTDQPTPWLPVLIEVRSPSGLPDRFLTDRLQARIKQPTSEDLSRTGFDVVQLVDTALKEVLPDEECRIDYEALRDGQPANRGDLYKVAVSLSGKRNTTAHELTGEEEVRDEESIDW